MRNPSQTTLAALLVLYCVASLIHFIHNAEFLADYPNLPRTWTPAGVYGAWAVMTSIGAMGWILFRRGFVFAGLAAIAAYAVCGLDSLGHYVLAPMSAHTLAMNGTILFEVTAAALLLVEIARQATRRFVRSR